MNLGMIELLSINQHHNPLDIATSTMETSSLTSQADLTLIHAESGLPFEHTSRRTKNDFLVEGDLLQGHLPKAPSKRDRDSWVRKHGEAITRKSDAKKQWLCRICYDNKHKLFISPAAPTTGAIRHLVNKHGFNEKGEKISPKRKRDTQEQLPVVVRRQLHAQSTVLDRADWQNVYLAWTVGDDVSMSKAASRRLQRLLLYRSPLLTDVVPSSRTTVRRWKIAAFKQNKPEVK